MLRSNPFSCYGIRIPGLTLLEALNIGLVCDVMNTTIREIFLQIAYSRLKFSFSEGGLPIGAGKTSWLEWQLQ
nr:MULTISPECIES: hypothetical protein [unclassified Fusobacterium]